MLSLDERAAAYSDAFPKYPKLVSDKGWLYGVWMLGQLFRRGDATIYGGYPGNYLKRLLALFPDMEPKRTLHIFAGNTPLKVGGVRVDLNIERKPSCVATAQALPFLPNSFDFVVADPPYSPADATRYGFPMVVRRKVMRELRQVVSDCAYLCWLDTVRPMYRRDDWQQVGAIAVTVSTNTRTRMVSIFRAVSDGCPDIDKPREEELRFNWD